MERKKKKKKEKINWARVAEHSGRALGLVEVGRKLREWWKIETFEEEEPQGENWRWGAKGGGEETASFQRGDHRVFNAN